MGFPCFIRCISRELDPKWDSRNTEPSSGMVCQLTCCTAVPTHTHLLNRWCIQSALLGSWSISRFLWTASCYPKRRKTALTWYWCHSFCLELVWLNSAYSSLVCKMNIFPNLGFLSSCLLSLRKSGWNRARLYIVYITPSYKRLGGYTSWHWLLLNSLTGKMRCIFKALILLSSLQALGHFELQTQTHIISWAPKHF